MAMFIAVLVVIAVPIIVATLGFMEKGYGVQVADRGSFALSVLSNAILVNRAFTIGVGSLLYNITVLVSNNMSIYVDRTGYLTVYLRNRDSARVHEAFEWVVQGYRPPGFPARFVGYVEPGREVVVYKAYLPRIINRTGRYRIIIMSSEMLTFNVSIASQSEILKVKELVSKITPILRIECGGSEPAICRASLPKYSLYIEVEVRLNPRALRHLQVIEKPQFIEVGFATDIEDVLKVIGEDKFFREMWGGKNITAILLYLVNHGDENLTVVSWGGYSVRIIDAYSGEAIGGFELKPQVLRPNTIVVKPGEKKLIDVYIVEYRDGVVRVNGFDCGRAKPSMYIVSICTETKPGICIAVSMELGPHTSGTSRTWRQLCIIEKPWFIDLVSHIEGDRAVIELFIVNRRNTSLRIVNYMSWDIAIYDVYGEPLSGCSLVAYILKPREYVVEPGQRKFISRFKLEYSDNILYVNGANCAELKPGNYIMEIKLRTRPRVSVKVFIDLHANNRR
ncbi:MAG: hypothetical protein DRO39_02310 [Thermoprotei archaeon]|nr:MAG: hypothetical protein DRO39_02310 [Thermoprotei archaeon]